MTEVQANAYYQGKNDYWHGQRANPFNFDADLAKFWAMGYTESCDKEIFRF